MRHFRNHIEDEDEEYQRFLKQLRFNSSQIDFLLKQRKNYLHLRKQKDFHYDTYERDMWYTMNQSGLFENTKDNIIGIVNWTPQDTRLYITEI